ncbi:sugar ABC transporter permease [Notoacmeibacter marinus]|uniref:Xylose transport system permease protein XylH n=1 Tax=Notoacmeibacter marinus TaxID=1876515 RepID=A0A231V0M4_9HYPH|nr:sugar ABC transporter permease [Notoacmeibacter marinus]OXT01732.1 sugar ABC transporter permease [Notoacmeibacter marinus]
MSDSSYEEGRPSERAAPQPKEPAITEERSSGAARPNAGPIAREKSGPVGNFLHATEIDQRLLGMVGALVLIWLGFHFYGEFANGFGAFLTSRNLWNLTVQTASIGVMATGMVLVIVTRHIDLSVGSMLGLCAMVMGLMQARWLPELVGLGWGGTWIVAIMAGLLAGALVGALHGFLIAYGQIPSFIVTLGGLLVWRGVAYLMARGETISPLDPTFNLLGGGPYGSIGSFWSWALGIVACLAIGWALYNGRNQRKRFGFPTRPVWAEIFVGALGCLLVIGFVMIVNAYGWPRGIVRQYAASEGIEVPEGGIFISHGFAIPVLILIAVGLFMTFLTTRTRFGRYVFAIGGNPEAAELAGINVRFMTVKIFALMGTLAGIAAVISSARLNSATNSLGTLDELYVIASAVIGGTSLAGGIGTIYGAIIGALLMQSLQTGMVLIGFDSAVQQIVVGGVLVLAVFLDTIYRRRAK